MRLQTIPAEFCTPQPKTSVQMLITTFQVQSLCNQTPSLTTLFTYYLVCLLLPYILWYKYITYTSARRDSQHRVRTQHAYYPGKPDRLANYPDR